MLSYPDWRDATAGDLAVYALPYEPFWTALPLLFWARIVDSGEHDEIVGLISYRGEVVPADSLTPGELFGYVRGSTHDSNVIALITQRVTERGRELHREAFPQPATPVNPLPESLSGEPTRSRRNRRPQASEETT
jgi:hypothetical protein